MEMISGDYILNGVCRQLKELFPEDTVYVERQSQHIKRSCFMVRIIDMSDRKLMRNRHSLRFIMQITWLPLKSASNMSRDCYNKALQMSHGLSLLQLPDLPVFTRETSYTVTREPEAKLIFTCIYMFHVNYEYGDSGPLMGELEINEYVKDEDGEWIGWNVDSSK